ncbi:MAG: DNA methyltransferase [Micrococcaceae bacterium]
MLLDEGRKEYFKTIKDGSGNDIKIYQHHDYQVRSVKELAKESNLSETEIYLKYYKKIFRLTNAQTSIRDKVNLATNSKEFFSIEYLPRSGKDKGILTTKYFLNGDLFAWLSAIVEKNKKSLVKQEKRGTLWSDFSWTGIAKEGGVNFKNGKKPVAYIQEILNQYESNKATVLDFFAGSGTTGHAVLQQNEEDGGNRQFILCTNNENNIAENITYERIKNVINGYGKTKGIPANLRYLKTEFLDKTANTDAILRPLTQRSTDLVRVREDSYELCLEGENYKVFKGLEAVTAIIFNDDSAADCIKAIEEANLATYVHLYVFSYNNYVPRDDWPQTDLDIEVCPIPVSILEVYRRLTVTTSLNNK